MNWEAIGSMGEIAGAIAVVLTLLYLARQIEGTKTAMRIRVSQDLNEMFNAAHHVIASSPSLAEAISKVESGTELNPQEQIQFRSLNMTFFNAYENMH